jgi:hypothetical protein
MELLCGGRGRGGIVIVHVSGNVRQIMASAGGATEGIKGNVWVHRWQLVTAGKDGKGGGRQQGGVGLRPSKLMVVNSFWQRRWMTNFGIGRGDNRGGQWQCWGVSEVAGCGWWWRGEVSKARGQGGIVIFRMGHVLGYNIRRQGVFSKLFFVKYYFNCREHPGSLRSDRQKKPSYM